MPPAFISGSERQNPLTSLWDKLSQSQQSYQKRRDFSYNLRSEGPPISPPPPDLVVGQLGEPECAPQGELSVQFDVQPSGEALVGSGWPQSPGGAAEKLTAGQGGCICPCPKKYTENRQNRPFKKTHDYILDFEFSHNWWIFFVIANAVPGMLLLTKIC